MIFLRMDERYRASVRPHSSAALLTPRVIALALVLAAPRVAAAQPSPPSFEAASIKRNTSAEVRTRFEMPPGRLTAVNVPLRFLIRQAYKTPEARVIGGPAWLDTDRFDITATTSGAVTSDAAREMLRTLLASRFGLQMHQDAREMPIYVLKMAGANGTLGPNLQRSSTDCTGRATAMANGRVQCGILVSQGPGSGSLRGGAATMDNFARLLGDFLDRPLDDETGLSGTFDFELQFTAPRSAAPGAAAPGGLATAAAPDDIPTIFTAIQEQLGLKLDAQRGRADVWVIDRASAPTEN
jgi:uncharacterized protein (TIGR03435 family)